MTRKPKGLRFPRGAKKAALRHVEYLVLAGSVSAPRARKLRGIISRARALL